MQIIFEVTKCEEEASTTIFSDSEVKAAGPQFKNSESLNNSFEIHNSGKINSSDDENSGQDSCSSLQTLGNERIQHSELSKTGLKPINKYQHTRIKQSKGLSSKIINESNLPKVNWIIGFEEASSRNLFE